MADVVLIVIRRKKFCCDVIEARTAENKGALSITNVK
jgi:hypothetical protein